MTEPKRTELRRSTFHPWNHDHFRHMHLHDHKSFFDGACCHLWAALGIGDDRKLERHGAHCVTAKATTGFVKELVAGDLIVIDGAVTRIGTKSSAFDLRMLHVGTGALHATCDVVEVFFDPAKRKAAPMPEAVRAVQEGLPSATQTNN